MKRIMGRVAVLAGIWLTCAPVTSALQAQSGQSTGPPPPHFVELCNFFVDQHFFPSFGQCVAGFRANSTKECQKLREAGLPGTYGFSNLGECVSTFLDTDTLF
jgi:hypothetical protein